MTETYDAMLEHMANIVYDEKRYFTFKDFLNFSVNEKNYKLKYGTIRNYFSKLKKNGEIDFVYNSSISFYTLKGVNLPKRITPTHTGVSYNNNPLYRLLLEHPLDKTAIHDIRLLFTVEDIWKYLSIQSRFKLHPINKSIELDKWNIDNDFFVKVIVNKTDSVSVSIGCSYTPIFLSIDGIIRFASLLARIEERLSGLLQRLRNDDNVYSSSKYPLIPSYDGWIVKMWHLNRDGSTEYDKEKFHISWENAEHIIIRAYTKQLKDKKWKIRLERQEYPNKSVFDAINDRLEERFQPNN